MAHGRFEFPMPASAAVAFDVFHYHHWRLRWDSLAAVTEVLGGAPCPYVGAVTESSGAGWLRGLAMSTRFVSFDRPHLAAASMVGRSFPFTRWAASMQHRPIDAQNSILIYTYTFEAWPRALRWLIEPVVHQVFDRQTIRRFGRMRRFLAEHADELIAWQEATQ